MSAKQKLRTFLWFDGNAEEAAFGLSWQIVPSAVPRLMSGADPERSKRVMEAIFAMRKLDIAALERAYAGA